MSNTWTFFPLMFARVSWPDNGGHETLDFIVSFVISFVCSLRTVKLSILLYCQQEAEKIALL